MKKYVFVASVVTLVVGVIVHTQQSSEVVAHRSVEFDIAELSPNGVDAGYAMPASGGSPPTSQPGVAIGANPVSVDFGDPITIAWYHGIVPGVIVNGGGNTAPRGKGDGVSLKLEGGGNFGTDGQTNTINRTTGFLSSFVSYAGGGGSGWVDTAVAPPPSLEGILEGLNPWNVTQACVAICNLDQNTCDQSNEAQWFPLDRNGGGVAPIAWGDIGIPSDEFTAIPGVAYAGKRGKASCNNATAVSNTFVIDTDVKGSATGNYLVGIKGSYTASYRDGDHSSRISRTGVSDSVMVSVGAEPQPELIAQVDIADQTFPAGQDLDLSATLINMGTGATDWKDGEDGLFGYTIKLDVNNDGFTDGTGGDMTIASAATFGPLARHFNISSPWKVAVSPVWNAVSVVAGTHSIEVCVDQPSTVTEVQEGNNCTTATFTVANSDVAAYALSGTYYAVFGEPLKIIGVVRNIGELGIDTPFKNQIEIRKNAGSSVMDDASIISALAINQGDLVRGAGIDHKTVFGDTKNLEYRVWVDTEDDLKESNDNVPFDTNGNNVSAGWADLELINPEIHPEAVDMNGAAIDGYWGPFVYGTEMTLVFDTHNDIPNNYGLAIGSLFESVIAIDADSPGESGYCADGALLSDSCIDYRIPYMINGIPYNGVDREFNTDWTTNNLGMYRARVYADSEGLLEENNKTDNVTTWESFEVVESLPGQEVSIEAGPMIVRKGDKVVLTWDLGAHTPLSCRVTRNGEYAEDIALTTQTGTKDVYPNNRTVYDIQCTADGTLSGAKDSVTVQVLPSLYES